MKSFQLAVAEFAVPAPKTGSIEMYSGYGGLPNSGLAIHQHIQNERIAFEPHYQAEKWIAHTFAFEGLEITVGGRMDGYIPGLPPRIEEIKSAFETSDLIKALNENPHHPYRLQVRTYGYLQFLATGVEPELDLVIVSSRHGTQEDYPVDLDLPDYEKWLKLRLKEVALEARNFDAIHKRRRELVKNFVFPFPEPRRGQIELMEKVDRELGKKSRLLLQAPTGLGKTAGILFPVLKESLKRGQKVIYVTPKNSQHAVGEDAVRRLQSTGTKVKGLTINAKAKMCFKAEVICNPEYCEFAKDYYTKVSANDLPAKLAKKKILTAKTFEKMGREYEVCPFELQMEAVPKADVVICDYNYVFSPTNSLGRLTHNGYGKKTMPNLVIDEAHNLPARAKDYFSAKISVRELQEVIPSHGHEPAIHEAIALIRNSGSVAGPVDLNRDAFAVQDAKIQEVMARHLASPAEIRPRDPLIKLANDFSNFTRALEFAGEQFYFTYNPSLDGGTLKVTCCDASMWLKTGYGAFNNVVAFSATVKPFDYYSRLLGFDSEEVVTGEFTSPFPRENRKLLIIPQVSTKFNDRQSNYGKITEGIERIVSVRKGNYFAFFPSFDFMMKIAERLNLPDVEILLQTRDMKKSQIQEYLEKLRAADHPILIMAVQGGVFSEGVDYPGNMLIGAIVVGPGLPSFDYERELLRNYYEKKYGHGFDYAYTFPAMAKVVQSAGRVIRSHDDLGLIVLMDRRFTHTSYTNAMPTDWLSGGEVSELVSTQVIKDIETFWKSHDFDRKDS